MCFPVVQDYRQTRGPGNGQLSFKQRELFFPGQFRTVEIQADFTHRDRLVEFDQLLQQRQVPRLMMLHEKRVQAKGWVKVRLRIAQCNKSWPAGPVHTWYYYTAYAGLPGAFQYFLAILVEVVQIEVAVGVYEFHVAGEVSKADMFDPG